ncbi:MAG: recombinase RecT [Defluviitaleaceae bacterium]|nr:recombinase RecT [Defluviitaleaceae bacterium]
MTEQNQAPPTTPPEQPPAEVKPTQSERFTAMVMKEFNGKLAGGLQITDFQRQLIQGYFIATDRALKMAEENRVAKNKSNSDHSYDNPLACTWENVNALDLALDVVHYARMGLDMMQDNHLFPIPYRNKKTSKYDVTLMPGYNGIQYIAEKYAVEKPLAVTVELVYSTDKFKPIKKNSTNKVEAYEFEITNAFDRGEIIGGFGYIEYPDPTKNKLVMMTRADILKRKPEYAAAEFWGGKTTKWENKKKVEVETDGWFAEMCLKTVKREVFSAKHIPRDPQKVDDNYQYMRMREAQLADMNSQAEIYEHANTITLPDENTIDMTPNDDDTPGSNDAPPPPPPPPAAPNF